MEFSAFYSVKQPAQEAAAPASASGNSAPPPQTGIGQRWTVVTWFGILLALVLLRIVYELSD